ncbi:transporter [Seongchinamella sediminis]|uniref:transporter n=1 Tax=Seongchinamella sediminis TaxID=2283635 RepID=UPI001EF07EA4|nr:transporter [Seongchinamella sediminis]
MIALLLLPACLWASTGLAQELTPRAYWPAPQGTRILTLGAGFTEGDTVPDPSLPISGVDSRIATGMLAYMQTLDLFGRTSNLIIEQAYSAGETTVDFPDRGSLSRDYQGAGDLAATLSVNLMGAPSMNREEFAELRRNPRPILGASLKVVAPTGRYDEDRLLNVGSNRWAAKAELGYMAVLRPRWLLEFELGVWVFDDNDEFLGMTRKQGSIRSVEMHLVRRFSPGLWASLDLTGYRGGQSEIGGRRLDDLQRDSKFGFTLAYPFAGRHALRFSYATGSVNDSEENFDVLQLSYSRLF